MPIYSHVSFTFALSLVSLSCSLDIHFGLSWHMFAVSEFVLLLLIFKADRFLKQIDFVSNRAIAMVTLTKIEIVSNEIIILPNADLGLYLSKSALS